MSGQFFALFSRMKNINRWALMRNTREESLSQHSLEVAATAHALAVIGHRRLGKAYDAPMAALAKKAWLVKGDKLSPWPGKQDE